MKLAACYTVFNACELLEKSIKQIYDNVDHVIIAYQDDSNVGGLISYSDLSYIKRLSRLDKVKIIKFYPDLSLNPKVNELNKHQLLLDKAKELNCSHFFLSATDHFYKTNEFIKAKEIAKDYDVTSTKMYTYYKDPSWQLEPIEDYQMPFICKIYPHTKFDKTKYHIVVDPSVRINTRDKFYEFNESEIMMHHYSMVRDDINSKFDNAAAAQNWKHKIPEHIEEFKNAKLGDKISYFGGRKLIEVDNFFKI